MTYYNPDFSFIDIIFAYIPRHVINKNLTADCSVAIQTHRTVFITSIDEILRKVFFSKADCEVVYELTDKLWMVFHSTRDLIVPPVS